MFEWNQKVCVGSVQAETFPLSVNLLTRLAVTCYSKYVSVKENVWVHVGSSPGPSSRQRSDIYEVEATPHTSTFIYFSWRAQTPLKGFSDFQLCQTLPSGAFVWTWSTHAQNSSDVLSVGVFAVFQASASCGFPSSFCVFDFSRGRSEPCRSESHVTSHCTCANYHPINAALGFILLRCLDR